MESKDNRVRVDPDLMPLLEEHAERQQYDSRWLSKSVNEIIWSYFRGACSPLFIGEENGKED